MKSPTTLMVQGTTSDAGKSVLVAALGRILKRHGISVAPFKPQNMALNSAVTAEGGEIGRAQAVQAMACGLEPHVDMNPVLLKPCSDTGAQVIVLGQAIGNMQAWGYHDKKPSLLPEVLAAHQRLCECYQAVVVEGAGSPAEINLRDNDIANMGFAESADCAVVIVADIDKGGVFAHLYGTYLCLSDSERDRVKGFVINKFRGDISLLHSANDWLTEKTGVPVLAVIPYIPDLYIEAEDAFDFRQQCDTENTLNVAVICYPRTSNHTDFDPLRLHPEVNLQFVRKPDDIRGNVDWLILPGSKSVQSDLQWLKDRQWPEVIHRHLRYRGKVLGICGGYQMLGNQLFDPHGIEGPSGQHSDGLGLLNMDTTLQEQKSLENVTAHLVTTGSYVQGYEIHAGTSQGPALDNPIHQMKSDHSLTSEGSESQDKLIRGTYIHGLFDEPNSFNDWLRWAGLTPTVNFDANSHKEEQLNYLADEVEKAWPVDNILSLLALND